MTSVFIEDNNLSHAWARAIQPLLSRGSASELAPVCVSITGFEDGVVLEDSKLRASLDQALVAGELQDCHAVANTIFPQSFWNPNVSRTLLFDRYMRALPQLKKMTTKNRLGLYF